MNRDSVLRRSKRAIAVLSRTQALWMLLSVLLWACASHVDLPYRVKYSRNKLLVIAIALENCKARNGTLPPSLPAIQQDIVTLIKSNPQIAEKYLGVCWQSPGPGPGELAPGFHLVYVTSQEQTHYFLAAPNTERLMAAANFDYLSQQQRNGHYAKELQYVVYDGTFVFSRFGPSHPESKLDEASLEKMLWPYKCEGRTFTW